MEQSENLDAGADYAGEEGLGPFKSVVALASV